MTGSEERHANEKQTDPAGKKAEEQTESRKLDGEDQAAVDELETKIEEQNTAIRRLINAYTQNLDDYAVSLVLIKHQRTLLSIPEHPSDGFAFTEEHLPDLPHLIGLAEQERLSRGRLSECRLQFVQACDEILEADRKLLTVLSTNSTNDSHYEKALHELRTHEMNRQIWMGMLKYPMFDRS